MTISKNKPHLFNKKDKLSIVVALAVFSAMLLSASWIWYEQQITHTLLSTPPMGARHPPPDISDIALSFIMTSIVAFPAVLVSYLYIAIHKGPSKM